MCAVRTPSWSILFIYKLKTATGRTRPERATRSPGVRLELAELLAGVDGGGAELLLDAHELVVLGGTLRAAGGARLDLRARAIAGGERFAGDGRKRGVIERMKSLDERMTLID